MVTVWSVRDANSAAAISEQRLYWARTGGADEARTCCGGQEVVAMTQSWLLEAMKCAEREERGGN